MIKLVLWDWNGTILDDLQISLAAVNRLFVSDGKPEIDLQRYYECVDTPISKFYEHFYDLSVTPFSHFGKIWRETYNELSSTLSLTPDCLDCLEHFRKMGCKQTIISASHADDVLPYIERFGIGHYFDKVITADDKNAGSKIEKAREYFASAGTLPDETIFIGDTTHDMEVAEALGVKGFLVTTGHQSEKQFFEAGIAKDRIVKLRDLVERISFNA